MKNKFDHFIRKLHTKSHTINHRATTRLWPWPMPWLLGGAGFERHGPWDDLRLLFCHCFCCVAGRAYMALASRSSGIRCGMWTREPRLFRDNQSKYTCWNNRRNYLALQLLRSAPLTNVRYDDTWPHLLLS